MYIWKWLARRVSRVLGHPSSTRLLDWVAGELDGRLQAATSGHVFTCTKCQRETERIRALLARSSAALDYAAAPPSAEHAVERLPELLRNQALIRATQERYRQERALRLAAVLRPYLGQYPLSLLERSESGEYVPRACRLAGLFLGSQAAAALTDVPGLEAARPEGHIP
ncbi:MAG: hypothetical protein IT159_13640 [Bryobacterales bacterium]|nr:hypothetical protein [Bryobacterales bacterium]